MIGKGKRLIIFYPSISFKLPKLCHNSHITSDVIFLRYISGIWAIFTRSSINWFDLNTSGGTFFLRDPNGIPIDFTINLHLENSSIP